MLRKICHNVNGIILLNLYKTYILPIIEFSHLCFKHNTTQVNQLEKIERKITNYICYELEKPNLKYYERQGLLDLKLTKREKYKL